MLRRIAVKNMVILVYCIMCLPCTSRADERGTPEYYTAVLISPLLNDVSGGTLAVAVKNQRQSVLAIEHTTGDIGSGILYRTQEQTSGSLDFYDKNGNYYTFSFESVFLHNKVLASGTITHVSTKTSGKGYLLGWRCYSCGQ